MSQPLYPLVLTIRTPYGVADFGSVIIGTPTVLREAALGGPSEKLALDGSALLSFPPRSPGRQLVLSIPEEHACPFHLATVLQQCGRGERVSITENLTRRDTLRRWEGLVVMEPDTGSWVAGNPEQGDHFTLLMTFRLP